MPNNVRTDTERLDAILDGNLIRFKAAPFTYIPLKKSVHDYAIEICQGQFPKWGTKEEKILYHKAYRCLLDEWMEMKSND